MKFTVFVALSCLCICLANSAKDPKLTTWGDVNNGHILHKEKIFVASSFMQIRTFILEYPKGVPANYPITGIKHYDYKSHPVEVKFKNGDIGERSVTLKIESQRNHGINSTFVFYTK